MWTDKLCDQFNKFGARGNDFLHLLTRIEKEQSMNLICLLGQATKGLGVTVHEGLGYVLENDYEDPSEFEGLTFFFGDHESEVMNMSVFLVLLTHACTVYVEQNPRETDTISKLLGLVQKRYSIRS